MAARTGYSPAQIALHWIVAVLVVFNYFYSGGMGRALAVKMGLTDRPLTIIPQIHVIVGVSVLVLVLIRLALRASRGVPEAPGAGLARAAAIWGHRLLYALLIAVPVLGGLTWFGEIRALGDAHEILANVLLVVVAGHAIMALVHHYVHKDGVLTRMFRAR